jgi:hypothetical protein
MILHYNKSIFKRFINESELETIRITTNTESFFNQYDSISCWWRRFKNSKISISGSITNRKYFKNLSGCYFVSTDGDKFTIIIVYDPNTSNISKTPTTIRIKKTFIDNIDIEYGTFYGSYKEINEMMRYYSNYSFVGKWYKKDK